MSGDAPFAGRTAIVTGGTSGIGGAVTRMLREGGAKVAVLSNESEDSLRSAQEAGEIDGFACLDIADNAAVERAVDWALTVDDPGMVAEEQMLDLTLPDQVYEWWGPDVRWRHFLELSRFPSR